MDSSRDQAGPNLQWTKHEVQFEIDGRAFRLSATTLMETLAKKPDEQSGQFRLSILDLPVSASIHDARIADHINGALLEVEFEEMPDLVFRTHLQRLVAEPVLVPKLRHWSVRPHRSNFTSFRLDELEESPSRLQDWLAAFLRNGLVFATEVPTDRDGLKRTIDLFGHIRETNYGRIFNVRMEADASNLAYTTEGLALHTDNPYRSTVPEIQALHCIENSAEGGESLVADGFAAAERLREQSESDFQLVATREVRFQFIDRSEQAVLEANRPMIALDSRGNVRAVHFNHRSLQPLDSHPDVIDDFRSAFRRFAVVLADTSHHLMTKLAPGDLMLMDNRRILHGRTSFDLRSGSRHLQGCYCDKDGLESRWRYLAMKAKDHPHVTHCPVRLMPSRDS